MLFPAHTTFTLTQTVPLSPYCAQCLLPTPCPLPPPCLTHPVVAQRLLCLDDHRCLPVREGLLVGVLHLGVEVGAPPGQGGVWWGGVGCGVVGWGGVDSRRGGQGTGCIGGQLVVSCYRKDLTTLHDVHMMKIRIRASCRRLLPLDCWGRRCCCW